VTACNVRALTCNLSASGSRTNAKRIKSFLNAYTSKVEPRKLAALRECLLHIQTPFLRCGSVSALQRAVGCTYLLRHQRIRKKSNWPDDVLFLCNVNFSRLALKFTHNVARRREQCGFLFFFVHSFQQYDCMYTQKKGCFDLKKCFFARKNFFNLEKRFLRFKHYFF